MLQKVKKFLGEAPAPTTFPLFEVSGSVYAKNMNNLYINYFEGGTTTPPFKKLDANTVTKNMVA